ncbi:YggT family protein [Granulosicoccus antarcticus]|uniref:YggT family protein n=1 Tax=Granulosicoccus antarcticus IMCC3135 TaxID=1192854 RepID=A0A2Z2NMZ3_9GAMM|nr:YggT family protein [Granulosicoccus antarcticus]ASJ71281.1 hypothetical protein IMCC3135_05845 [Granulosicoccus antarcticus IMCC3135]
MANPALNALGFILGILFNLYATVVAVRFVMQIVRADYYNPVAQSIVQITDPLLLPLRRIIPSFKRYDTSSLVLCFSVLLLKLLLFKLLSLGYVPALGQSLMVGGIGIAQIVILALLDLIHQLFNVFIFALIIQAILSWLPGATGNPVHSLATSISAPILQPLRKRLPPMGGLDLTVFFSIIGLYAIRIFLLGMLQQIFGL